ncbi:MAG: aldose 1-epimerase family protein [Anaerostipes sp.]|jgi:galactose mutarotase-like enzyme|nr:aldose 1-epimerase family protein [Anaerostipes sp.]
MTTYKIQSDDITVVTTSAGAEICSITSNKTNTNYLWSGNPQYWRGRAPILFPMVGCLREDKAKTGINDSCRMGRHGLARNMEFEMIHLCKSRITYALKSNSDTKDAYPYDFELHITYVAEGKTLRVHHSIKNQDTKEMPFCIGGHPAFHCPINKDENFEDYQVRFSEKETADCAYLTDDGLIDMSHSRQLLDNEDTIPLQHDLFYDDALVFDSLKSRSVTLEHKETKQGVTLTFDDMDYLGVWSSANDGPFVALEPWTGTATLSTEDDVFEHKRGIRILSPGELTRIEYQITVNE